MYQTFSLDVKKDHVEGYHWPVENPDYVVCVVHGIGEYAACYNRVADYFGEKKIALLSMDLPGHGRTYGKRGHAAPREQVLAHIDDLIVYAQYSYPGVPLILYGHSMGGNIALDYKTRGQLNDQIGGYVISAPWIYLVRPVSRALYNSMKVLAAVIPSFLINAGIDSSTLGNPKMTGAQTDKQLRHDKISVATALSGFEIGNALAAGQHKGNGKADEIPMLLMHGNQDRICKVEGSRALAALPNPHCTYIEWPGLYHEIHNGGPDSDGSEVIQKTIEWICSL